MATTQATANKAKISNLREHILNVQDLDEELVDVPGWGCTLLVRALTGAERAKFLKQVTAQQPGRAQIAQSVTIDWGRYWADLLVLAVRDPEDKTLIFTPTDRDALLAKNSKNLEAVASVARRLSGLEDNALESAKSEDEGE